jgi:membrane protein DedA with SNARE-associated domain
VTLDALVSVIVKGRYWILVPLSLIEGPTVALVAGALSSRGYLNPFWAYWIFFAKDVVVDGAYYYVGRFSGERRWVAALLKKARVTGDDLDAVRRLWDRHPWRTMAVGKLSWGLSPAFLAAAGVVSVPIAAFLRYAAGVALVQYATLIAVGYYFGRAAAAVSGAIHVLQVIAGGIAIAAIVYLRLRLRQTP